jgi:hypothetical protein
MSESASSSGGSSDAPQIDWSGLIQEWSSFSRDVIDRFSERAAGNADSARGGRYGREQWLDDVEWFWTHFGEDAAHAVQICRDKFASC